MGAAVSGLRKKGCAEGLRPSAGSLRVSLRYEFFPLPDQEGVRGMVERVFQHHVRRLRVDKVRHKAKMGLNR
jgi:hypothetical protein